MVWTTGKWNKEDNTKESLDEIFRMILIGLHEIQHTLVREHEEWRFWDPTYIKFYHLNFIFLRSD